MCSPTSLSHILRYEFQRKQSIKMILICTRISNSQENSLRSFEEYCEYKKHHIVQLRDISENLIANFWYKFKLKDTDVITYQLSYDLFWDQDDMLCMAPTKYIDLIILWLLKYYVLKGSWKYHRWWAYTAWT